MKKIDNRTSRRDFLNLTGKFSLIGLLAGPAFLTGCKTMTTLADLGSDIGNFCNRGAKAVKRSFAALAKSFEDITPEQEYYIGRTVGAIIVNKLPPEPDQKKITILTLWDRPWLRPLSGRRLLEDIISCCWNQRR